jgi:hypothetical protein
VCVVVVVEVKVAARAEVRDVHPEVHARSRPMPFTNPNADR